MLWRCCALTNARGNLVAAREQGQGTRLVNQMNLPVGGISPGTLGERDSSLEAAELRLLAVISVSRHHGVEMDRRDFRAAAGEVHPSPASLARWAGESGLSARAVRLRWRQLFRLTGGSGSAPVVLLLRDGGAGLLVGSDASRGVVWVQDPRAAGREAAVAVDELRLSQVWGGEALLVRRGRGEAESERPFTLGWLFVWCWPSARCCATCAWRRSPCRR